VFVPTINFQTITLPLKYFKLVWLLLPSLIFVGKARELTRMGHNSGRLWPCSQILYKSLAVTNALAYRINYYGKSFEVHALGQAEREADRGIIFFSVN